MFSNSEQIHTETRGTESVPQAVREAVFVQSACLPDGTPVVRGYNWDEGLDYSKLLQSFLTCGIQATNFGLAIKEINEMLAYRSNKDYEGPDYAELEEDEFIRPRATPTIFLGYSSNMVTCGTRETIRFLVKNKMVDCIVTTAGGVEEDFIKCLAPTYIKNFDADDRELRNQGINRVGNMLIPNENYCLFQAWITPILDKMVEEQKTMKVSWTPSKLIIRLGEEINNEESIYYWAAVNKIPTFCPDLTDGSLGGMMYFHSFRNPGLVLDIVEDVRRINTIAIRAKHTGTIILGGGIVKHQICNANMIRDGADFAVYISTTSEHDGSDGGAGPNEAISWGKIKKTATPIEVSLHCAFMREIHSPTLSSIIFQFVFGDASILFPLLVAETFAKHVFK